jgi:CRP/FNR family cyclic AMP-dependent transcriptional regulator
LELGFSFFAGAALLAASSLGLAMAQVNCETLPAGPGRNLGYANFTRCPPSMGVGCFHHRPIITRIQGPMAERPVALLPEGRLAMLQKSPPNHDDPPNHVGETRLAPGVSSSVKPIPARKLVADKLLWETLERWKRSSPELDRIQFLKTVPFFNELSHRQLKTVSDTIFERNYETDELIFEEGQPGAALFLILDGKVAVEMCRENHTTTLAILEKGAFFGEMALLNEAPRSANARSLERTYTLALYRNDLRQLIQRDPQTACQIYRALASMIGDRLRLTNELMETEISTEKV